MNTTLIEEQDLEQLALDAHQRGAAWDEFWRDVQKRVDALELDRDARKRLTDRLLHLLVSGEASDQFAAGDDDAAEPVATDVDRPHDTITRARLPATLQTLKDTEPTWGPSQLRKEREYRRKARAKAKARAKKPDKAKAESSK